jgi:hypothetical protein
MLREVVCVGVRTNIALSSNNGHGVTLRARVKLHSPAFAASQFEVCGSIGDMLVLEANLLCFRRLATGAAQLNLPLIDPPLIGRCVFHSGWRLHLAIELQLLHEALVRFDD